MVTHDLLCDAAEQALREGGLALCTIQEVAQRAGRSAGSVYRRFGDKDRMIVAVMERYLERALSTNEANLKMLADRYPRLEDRLKAIVEGTVTGQRRDQNLLQAFRDAAARSSNTELPDAARRVSNATLGFIRQAMRDCASEIEHRDKDLAIDIALNALGGAVDMMARGPARKVSSAAFQSEMHEMLYGYLTGAGGNVRPRCKTKRG
jgi:AcrR family transcriptional regulator